MKLSKMMELKAMQYWKGQMMNWKKKNKLVLYSKVMSHDIMEYKETKQGLLLDIEIKNTTADKSILYVGVLLSVEFLLLIFFTNCFLLLLVTYIAKEV